MSEFKVLMVGDTHIEPPGDYDGEDLLGAEENVDLVLGMGDWVQRGLETEYEQALCWAEKWKCPFTLVRGNHDNGPWNRYAGRVCPPPVADQLQAHSPVEQPGMVIWKPMVWEPSDYSTVASLPRQDWSQVPADTVQGHIVKLRDLTPGYYTFEAGDMLFVCLDASNWLLGKEQMAWVQTVVESADKPVVIATHHHFVPVGIQFDGAQVHERAFMRELVMRNRNVAAVLHGHAHKDRWWKYGDTDIVAVRNRTCRTVVFEKGRVKASILDGQTGSPQPFVPEYLCAQCMQPGQMTYLSDTRFTNPWGLPQTACLGWLPPNGEAVELSWTMQLPTDVSAAPHELSFQIRHQGPCQLSVTSPGRDDPLETRLAPCPDGETVTLEIGPLAAGSIDARLSCSEGWGYAAIACPLHTK